MESTITKKCSKCQQIKSIIEFHKSKHRSDHLNNNCKTCEKKRHHILYLQNTEYYTKQSHKRNQLKPDYLKNWRLKNSKYIQNYRKQTRNQRQKYEQERYKNDPNFRIINCLRSRIRSALKNNQKSGHTLELLGCTINELWIHLEKQFTQGMTRQNYGRWHIDHIQPCAMFNLLDPEQQKRCFHYTNLQPLWAEDNLRKSDTFIFRV